MRYSSTMFQAMLIVIALNLYKVFTLTSKEMVSLNSRYTSTNRFTIDTTATYGNSTVIWQDKSYVFTYPNIITSDSILALLSFDELSIDIKDNKINITTVIIWIGSSSLTVGVQSSIANNINRLSLRIYLASQSYAQLPTFVSYSAGSAPLINITNSLNYSFTFTKLSAVKFNTSISIYYSLTGYSLISYGSTNSFDIYLKMVHINSTVVNVTLGSKSTFPTYVEMIKFTWLSFDPSIVNSPSFGNFMLRSYSAISKVNLTSYSITNANILSFNSFYGLTGFSINKNQNFNFGFSIKIPSTLTLTSSNIFVYFNFNTLFVQTFYCSYTTPYLYVQSQICYDICPSRFYPSIVNYTCIACPYDCYTCANSFNCLSCNASTDFRVLNSVTSRCKPIMGYYDSGFFNPIAQKCSNNCLNCIDNNSCLSCGVGYYLKNNLCQHQLVESISETPNNTDNSSSQETLKYALIGSSCAIVAILTIFIIRKYCQRYCLRNQDPILEESNPRVKPMHPASLSRQQIVVDLPLAVPEPVYVRPVRVRPPLVYFGPTDWIEMPDQYEYPENSECAIDLQDRPLLRLDCGHYFHYRCIVEWRQIRRVCPLCIREIPNIGYLHCSNCLYRYKQVNLNRGRINLSEINNNRNRLCQQCSV